MSHLTCQKQHRLNEPAGQVDVPTRVEVCVMGEILDMCRDHRCLGDHCLSKTTQTE